jgi:FlaA1/EpsC-like NDP-sugar epimerase
MTQFYIRHRRAQIIALHLLLFPVGYYLAFLLRFDFDLRLTARYMVVFLETLPIVLAVRAVAFGAFGLYRGCWRYVGISDLTALLKAVTLSSALTLGVLYFAGMLRVYPRSVVFLDWAVCLLMFGGMRFAVRLVKDEPSLLFHVPRKDQVRAVVIGAGSAGERLIRELRRDRHARIAPVALVDDDPTKRGMSLHGVSVLGATEDLAEVARNSGAALAIIAIPSAARREMMAMIQSCKDAGLECQIVPSLPELLSGRAKLSQLRDVDIEDLLGRGAVELDLAEARQRLAGKVVMVTGGAGSIGSELARQLAVLRPGRLVLVEQAESALYFVQLELADAYPDLELVPVIADVTDRARMAELFGAQRPDFVFHAAAYKHVPLMEHNVAEAVRNNVGGTLCVAQNAARFGAEKFVLISTDKAVRPSSVMGATKRIAERIVLGWPTLVESRTDFRAVRFGNVLGSAGSVIPLFKAQLAKGGPLTVTDPEVTRYFMTIPEAAQLVLLAATLPEAAGRISMLEMGEAVRIADLAENLIRLSGLTPGVDVEVRYTGLRPGEKLYEELMSGVEETVSTGVEKIRVLRTHEADGGALEAAVSGLLAGAAAGVTADILDGIGAMVPECVSPLRDRVKRLGGASEPRRPAAHAQAHASHRPQGDRDPAKTRPDSAPWPAHPAAISGAT